MAGNSSTSASAILNAVAQSAFCDRPLAGFLVLAGFASVSPIAAAGVLIGAIVGTLLADFLRTWSRAEIEAGVAGVNLAILGAFLGLSIGGTAWHPMLAVLAVAACLAIEQALRRLLGPYNLPILSLPAVLSVLAIIITMGAAGASFWPQRLTLLSDGIGLAPAIVLFAAAMATKSIRAAAMTGALTAFAAAGSGVLLGTGAVGPPSLWAFTVAPAAFGLHAVFLAGSRLGAFAGIAGALAAGGIWAAWTLGPLGALAPPLLLPFIFGTWVVLAVVRRRAGSLVLDPHIWAAVEAIRKARSTRRPVVVLTGAGTSTASDIPDYLSGAWLDKDVPASTYSYGRFLESARCRRLYWEACDRFREVANRASPNRGHRALAALESNGWLSTTITQNVDGLHQQAGAEAVIELHGEINRVRCLSCTESGKWPPAGAWRKFDLCCRSCGGHLKPAVIAMGENIPPAAWERSLAAAKDCGVLLVIGSQMAVSSAAELLAKARDYGARIVFINPGAQALGAQPGDLHLGHRFEEALPAIARLLDCPPETKDARQGSAAGEADEDPQVAPPATKDAGKLVVY